MNNKEKTNKSYIKSVTQHPHLIKFKISKKVDYNTIIDTLKEIWHWMDDHLTKEFKQNHWTWRSMYMCPRYYMPTELFLLNEATSCWHPQKPYNPLTLLSFYIWEEYHVKDRYIIIYKNADPLVEDVKQTSTESYPRILKSIKTITHENAIQFFEQVYNICNGCSNKNYEIHVCNRFHTALLFAYDELQGSPIPALNWDFNSSIKIRNMIIYKKSYVNDHTAIVFEKD